VYRSAIALYLYVKSCFGWHLVRVWQSLDRI